MRGNHHILFAEIGFTKKGVSPTAMRGGMIPRMIVALFLTIVFALTSFSAQVSASLPVTPINNNLSEPASPPANIVTRNPDSLGGYFIENRGQVADGILYYSRGGTSVAFRDDGILFVIMEAERPRFPEQELTEHIHGSSSADNRPAGMRSFAYLLHFEGAKAVRPVGMIELPFKSNFFFGNDSIKWRTDVLNFREVAYEGLYEGIDLVYRLEPHGLKYEFKVHPHADPGAIRLSYDGIESLRVDRAVAVLSTPLGEIRDVIPRSYQEDGKDVDCSFVLSGPFSYGFDCRGRDSDKMLTIDPLVYSTFIGGCFSDTANSIAIDANGNAYVAGTTYSSNFSVTPGAYNEYFSGFADVFVSKLNPSGSALVYSTFLGGIDYEEGTGIAVDSAGDAYVTGYTQSSDFPVTEGAFDVTFNTSDAFVAKLKPLGDYLLFSTFLGGDGWERGFSIAVDAVGDAYATGYSASGNFPTTPGVFKADGGGAYVTKLDSTGSWLRYSTILGFGWGKSIVVDPAGDAIVAGWTGSGAFPTTAGAYDTSHAGGNCGFMNPCADVFVTKLDDGARSLIFSTFIGSGNWDAATSVTLDSNRNVYVTGVTNSTGYPVTPGAFDSQLDGPLDGFVTKLNPTGSSLVYSSYLGGDLSDYPASIAVDQSQKAYIAGCTYSTDFFTTSDAFDTAYNENGDVFVVQLNAAGDNIDYSTYVGYNKTDEGFGAAVNPIGNLYVAGETYSLGFPVTPGAFDTYPDTPSDAFVLRFKFGTLQNKPDLKIVSSDIDFYPPRPLIANRSVSINATVRNIGDVNASQVVVKLYNGFPLDPNQIDGNQTIPLILRFGGMGIASVPWAVGPPGNYQICVYADPDDKIDEIDDLNNIACITVKALLPLPDLVVFPGDILFSPPSPFTEGTLVRIEATVSNTGGNVSGQTLARFHDGTPPSPQIGIDQPVPPIPVYGSSIVSVDWTASAGGWHDVCVVVDPDNLVIEIDETNNMACVAVLVQSAPITRPDYIPTLPLPLPPIKVGMSSPVYLSIQVLNQGNGTATDDATVAFHEQSSPPFSAFVLSPLAPAATSSRFAATWISPATPGTCLVSVDVDFENNVTEWGEANNVYTWTIEVVSGPATSLIVGYPNYTSPAMVTYVKPTTPLSLSVLDQSGLGIRNTSYAIDGGTPVNYTATGTFFLAGEGAHTVEWRSLDWAGNLEDVSSKVLRVDDTPPATTIHKSDEQATTATVFTLAATDSGCSENVTMYRIDGGSWAVYSGGFTLPEGLHNISYYSNDMLNNTEREKWLVVNVSGSQVPPNEVAVNYKPVVALIFAIILLVAGVWSSKRRPWKGGKDRMAVVKAFAIISMPFVLAEAGTGIVSFAAGELRIPPYVGVGTAIDLAILFSGLAVALVRATRKTR